MQIQNQNPQTACIGSLIPLHVIYCRILHASKTQKMELRRSPEPNLWILSTARILRNLVVLHAVQIWVIVLSVACFF